MRLATQANGTPDGALIVVSTDGRRMLPGAPAWPNLLTVMAHWSRAEPALQALSARLDRGGGAAFAEQELQAPLPRSWQWLDASAFATHAELMRIAFGGGPTHSDTPLMYQGMSDQFYGPTEPVPFAEEAHGIDFEGEFGVITDWVPRGVSAGNALGYIRLLVQINDWSLRSLAPAEMKTGFGFIQAKPACSMAPYAVTPEELAQDWGEGRVCLDLNIDWNGARFGSANGREMACGFGQLIAHAAKTRMLCAGTIIGTGTVSNADYGARGSSCISERRAIEIIAGGKPVTQYMHFGDQVRMEAKSKSGRTPFGAIHQQVIRA